MMTTITQAILPGADKIASTIYETFIRDFETLIKRILLTPISQAVGAIKASLPY